MNRYRNLQYEPKDKDLYYYGAEKELSMLSHALEVPTSTQEASERSPYGYSNEPYDLFLTLRQYGHNFDLPRETAFLMYFGIPVFPRPLSLWCAFLLKGGNYQLLHLNSYRRIDT